MSVDIKDLIARYELLEGRVEKIKNEVNRESVELEYEKKNLKEKMEQLQKEGYDFKNVSELESELEKLAQSMDEILKATERKLSDI